MPRVGGLIGAFLLFAAFALLLVATISAPVFRQISFLDVYQGGQQTNFGTFGYCLQSGCTRSRLGYDMPGVINNIGAGNGTWVNNGIRALTNSLILHPIACGISFLAFVIALFAHRIGYLVATAFALVAFVVSVFIMAVDFAIFTITRNHVNNNRAALGGNVSASLGNALWMVLAATVCLFFAAFATCFSCCAARRERRYDETAADRRYIYRTKQVGVPEMYTAEADRMGLDATGRRSVVARY